MYGGALRSVAERCGALRSVAWTHRLLTRLKSALLGKRTPGLFRTLEDFEFRAGLFHLLWSVPVLYRHSSKYRLATGRYSGHWADSARYIALTHPAK
jgi:hypothetical protein